MLNDYAVNKKEIEVPAFVIQAQIERKAAKEREFEESYKKAVRIEQVNERKRELIHDALCVAGWLLLFAGLVATCFILGSMEAGYRGIHTSFMSRYATASMQGGFLFGVIYLIHNAIKERHN